MAGSGMLWEAVAGRRPMPPAARTLGFELVEADPEQGTITVGFTGVQAFTNPFGEVLGGFVAAMLYDTVGPALLATLGSGEFIETLDQHTVFLRPAPMGRLLGRGRVVGRRDDIAQLQASLSDSAGHVVATATATARIVSADPGPSARESGAAG